MNNKIAGKKLTRRQTLQLMGSATVSIGLGLGSATTAVSEEQLEYDYIIIGAGSAGCPLAARLLERKLGSVLLIEAGGTNEREDIQDFTQAWQLTQPESDVDWGYRSIGQTALANNTQSYSAGKVLGGSSAINGVVWARGHRGDFDYWEQIGCKGWGYQQVLPSFKHIETAFGNPRYRGMHGPIHVEQTPARTNQLSQAVVRAAMEEGHAFNPDYNGAYSKGVGFTQLNVDGLVRQDAYTAFIKPLLDNKNLRVLTHTTARRLCFDCDQKIEKVTLTQDNRKFSARARREVFVCAGTINSAKLLMLSGVGSPQMLADVGIRPLINSPGVGRNLQDHLISVAVRKLLVEEPASHFTTMDVSMFMGTMPYQWHGAPRYQVQSYYMRHGWGNYPPEALALGVINLHPSSRGTVSLNPKDIEGEPIIDPNFLSTKADIDSQLQGYRMVRRILAARALSSWVENHEHTPGTDVDTKEELLIALSNYSESNFHPVGTCKMGVDKMAVVNSKLQLYGARGIRVVGASIMPVLVSGNTNATSMMIGDYCGSLV